MTAKQVEFVKDMSELQAEFNAPAVEEILHRPFEFTDGDQFVNRIWAAAIHPEQPLIAWVEYRTKTVNGWFDDHFTLKVYLQGQQIINWALKTYNPAMGCTVGFFTWCDNQLVMIYTENHAIYAVSFALCGDYRLEQIGKLGFPWGVFDNILACRHIGQSHVHCWTIPSLNPLPNLTQQEAIAAGILR